MVDGGLPQQQNLSRHLTAAATTLKTVTPPGLSDPFASMTGVVKGESRAIVGLQDEHFYCLCLFLHIPLLGYNVERDLT